MPPSVPRGRSRARHTMPEPKPDTPDPWDVALEEAVAICEGDVRAALRAALVANSLSHGGGRAADAGRIVRLPAPGSARTARE
jgi:hypothetical protein